MTTTPPVTLDEFKKHLNLATNTSESDVELQMHLDAATEALEKRVGAMVTREFTERVTARGGLLLLANAPVVAVASVTEVISGTVWTVGDLYTAADSILRLSDGSKLPAVDYTVTYTAGRGLIADVPARFKLATLIVAEHLWETQRGTAVRPAMFGMATEPSTGTSGEAGYVFRGFALPRRALELLAGDQDIAFA